MRTDVLASFLPATAQDALLTYLLHSTLLLGTAWLFTRLLPRLSARTREALWSVALLGGFLTTTIQLASGYESFAGRVAWTPAPIETSEVPPAAEIEVVEVSDTWMPFATPEEATDEPLEAPAASPASSGVPWSGVLLAAWSLFVVVMLVRRGRGRRRLTRRIAARTPIEEGALRTLLDDLRARAGIRRTIRLSSAEGLTSPIAWGTRRPEIIVPARTCTDLQPTQQEAMLAHELAHHARRDPLWLQVHTALAALACFQPLNVLASRRLAEAAELLADEWAVEHTGRTRELAECLTTVARWAVGGSTPLAASAMAQPGSMLERRVATLLQRTPETTRRTRRGMWSLAAVPLALVAVFAPAVTSRAAPTSSDDALAQEQPLSLTTIETPSPVTELASLQREITALEDELAELVQWMKQIPEPPAALKTGVARLQARLATFQNRRDALTEEVRALMETTR